MRAGQVGIFGVVGESNNRSGYALRLKIVDGRIAEAEAIVVRVAEFSAPAERLISVANGYFDTLQLNDGTLFTLFDPQCQRYENGILTPNDPAKTLGPVTALGCEAQFKLGAYRFDDRLRQVEAVFITVPYNMPSPWAQ